MRALPLRFSSNYHPLREREREERETETDTENSLGKKRESHAEGQPHEGMAADLFVVDLTMIVLFLCRKQNRRVQRRQRRRQRAIIYRFALSLL